MNFVNVEKIFSFILYYLFWILKFILKIIFKYSVGIFVIFLAGNICFISVLSSSYHELFAQRNHRAGTGNESTLKLRCSVVYS